MSNPIEPSKRIESITQPELVAMLVDALNRNVCGCRDAISQALGFGASGFAPGVVGESPIPRRHA